MSNAKRKELAGTGRSAVGKTAIVGTKDRASNNVAAHPIPTTSAPYTAGFVTEKTRLGATVYTDEAAAYNALDPWFDRDVRDVSRSLRTSVPASGNWWRTQGGITECSPATEIQESA